MSRLRALGELFMLALVATAVLASLFPARGGLRADLLGEADTPLIYASCARCSHDGQPGKQPTWAFSRKMRGRIATLLREIIRLLSCGSSLRISTNR